MFHLFISILLPCTIWNCLLNCSLCAKWNVYGVMFMVSFFCHFNLALHMQYILFFFLQNYQSQDVHLIDAVSSHMQNKQHPFHSILTNNLNHSMCFRLILILFLFKIVQFLRARLDHITVLQWQGFVNCCETLAIVGQKWRCNLDPKLNKESLDSRIWISAHSMNFRKGYIQAFSIDIISCKGLLFWGLYEGKSNFICSSSLSKTLIKLWGLKRGFINHP